ncbi:MAG: hypothetical protein E7Z84_05420 [Methanosphaera stadtmanae]|nr:hypothetical protein [Methanosphaera stadtmanae]
MKSNPDIEKDILLTLFKHGCIGKHHTPIINLCRNLNQYPCKEIRKSIKSLRKKKLINLYKTYHGLDIRMIPSQLQVIKEIIGYEDNF